MEDNDNNKDDNDDKGISALGLDRDLDFSRGHKEHQGHRHPDDDNEEDDDEVEDNNKDDNNYKDDNNDKGISAPRLLYFFFGAHFSLLSFCTVIVYIFI